MKKNLWIVLFAFFFTAPFFTMIFYFLEKILLPSTIEFIAICFLFVMILFTSYIVICIYKNSKKIDKDDGIEIINRQQMLEELRIFERESTYQNEFEVCKAIYDYLCTCNLGEICQTETHFVKSENLSARNLFCIQSVIFALQQKNMNNYWHELFDFIHNYNSEEPVSYNEYHLFILMFQVGMEEFPF